MARKRLSDDVAGSAKAMAPSSRPPMGRAKHSPTRKTTPEDRGASALSAAAEVGPVAAPSRQEIARLAYAYWEARGWREGSSEEDWIRAERDLAARISTASA